MLRRMIFPVLMGVVGAGILISLGVWQVQRLAWKEGILARIEARIADDPVALPVDPNPERDQYLPVRVQGMFDGDDLAILVSQKGIGAGYRIVGAMETSTGRRIMVDRGFVALEDRNKVAPVAAITVTGNLLWPDEIDGWTPKPDRKAGIWFARDIPAMASELGTEPVLVVARAVSDATTGVTPLPVSVSGIPNDHLNYAITWFSLAIVWLGMTAYLLWRIRRRTD
jgi:surfeit locus 1 family protein